MRRRRFVFWGAVGALVGVAVPAGADSHGAVVLSSDGSTIVVPTDASPGAVVPETRGSGASNPGTSSPSDPAFAARPASPAGGPTPQSIITPDKRRRVPDTRLAPFRRIAVITFTARDGSFQRCTGFVVGPDTVATAGHCVHQGFGGGAGFHVRGSYRIYPGRNGSVIPFRCPDGTIPRATTLFTNPSWARDGVEAFDYGAVETNCRIGDVVGTLAYANTVGVSLPGRVDRTSGYPGERSLTQWISDDCSTSTTRFVPCRITTATARQVFYRNDTTAGHSGAPVWVNLPECAAVCVIGVHGYGIDFGKPPPHGKNNYGVRIEGSVFSFLNGVRRQ